MHLCIPYTALEPIRETLFSSVNANLQSNGRGWMGALSREIQPATVDLVAELTSAEITIAELINLSRGDIIEIDAVKGTLDVKLSADELAKRKNEWKARESEFGSGYLWKYAQQVGPAVNGAVTHPGGAAEKECYADI